MKEYTKYLVCAGCGKCLTGEEFTIVEEMNYCESCKPIPVVNVDIKKATPTTESVTTA